MIKGPCLNCEERYVGCHSKCKKYQQYRKELDEFNDRVAATRNKEFADIARAKRISGGNYWKRR